MDIKLKLFNYVLINYINILPFKIKSLLLPTRSRGKNDVVLTNKAAYSRNY